MQVRRARFVPLLVVAAALLAACGSSKDEATGSIVVSDPWCRTSAAMADTGACYMQIDNETSEPSALVKASVPPSVAGMTELHETTTDGGMSSETTAAMDSSMGTTGDDTSSGMMGMRPVDSIALPDGETVSLEPGGYHMMLLELAGPLASGAKVAITLTFEDGSTQQVEAVVRDR